MVDSNVKNALESGDQPISFPKNDADPIIDVRSVNHWFGDGEARKQALHDNNLQIMPGEIVIMTGPSGSGKTTLLTLIGALRTVQDGYLGVMGQNVAGLTANDLVNVRRNIGFIFQAHNLFSSLTAFQNVRMGLQLQNWEPQKMHDRAVELLKRLDLGHRIHYKPSNLSGGQRQRVAIARALGNRPRLVLADEPTAALDAKSGREVIDIMKEMVSEDRPEGRASILIVTHDNRILDAAHRIVNMVDGAIISNVLVVESVALCMFLSKCEAFKDLTVDALTKVAEKMTKVSYKKGDVIIRQGDEGDTFFVLRKGVVEVYDEKPGGKRQHLTDLKEGQFFGEKSLLTGQPRSATVIAKDSVETYTLDTQSFLETVKGSDSVRQQIYKAYFQRQ